MSKLPILSRPDLFRQLHEAAPYDVSDQTEDSFIIHFGEVAEDTKEAIVSTLQQLLTESEIDRDGSVSIAWTDPRLSILFHTMDHGDGIDFSTI